MFLTGQNSSEMMDWNLMRDTFCFCYLSCKNDSHFTGLACWEKAKGSVAGKVAWSPEKMYNKGHSYSLEALQLSKLLQTRYHHENFSMHFSRGYLDQKSSGIKEDKPFSPPILELLNYLPVREKHLERLWNVFSLWLQEGFEACVEPWALYGMPEWVATCDVELQRKIFSLRCHSSCNKVSSSLGSRQ